MSDELRIRQPTETRPTDQTDELDYRFTLANERTFLAWVRTALALIGGGLAVDQLLPDLARPAVRISIASFLLVLGATTAVYAASHWARTEQRMRSGGGLPTTRYPGVLAGVLALGAFLLLLVVLFGGGR